MPKLASGIFGIDGAELTGMLGIAGGAIELTG